MVSLRARGPKRRVSKLSVLARSHRNLSTSSTRAVDGAVEAAGGRPSPAPVPRCGLWPPCLAPSRGRAAAPGGRAAAVAAISGGRIVGAHPGVARGAIVSRGVVLAVAAELPEEDPFAALQVLQARGARSQPTVPARAPGPRKVRVVRQRDAASGLGAVAWAAGRYRDCQCCLPHLAPGSPARRARMPHHSHRAVVLRPSGSPL